MASDGYAAHHGAESARHQQQHNRCDERPADDVGQRRHVSISGQDTAPAPRPGRRARRRSASCRSGAGARRGPPVPSCRAFRAQRAGDDPPIEPVGHRGQEIVQPNDGGLVKLVEVEAVAHGAGQCAQLLRQRVFGRIRVKRVSGEKPDEHGQQTAGCRDRRVEERRRIAPVTKERSAQRLGGKLRSIELLDADEARRSR